MIVDYMERFSMKYKICFLDLINSIIMTLDSLSESSLLRLEQYLNSNPYREYSMNKPYLPKTSQNLAVPNRSIPSQHQPSVLAFHELMDNQKNSLTLDRLAYKLRMKSDLNIDTLRETHIRRRHRHYHPQQNHINSNISDTLSSIPASTKTFTRQPTSITMSTNTMKTLMTDDLNGIEGNAVRVGTLDDLIKQFRRAEFRLVRRPADYLDSSSYISSNVSTNDRTTITKSHQQNQERPLKQPQALTEYRFNVPTFPTTPTRSYREPSSHQGLIYQYRTRERTNNTDLPLLHQRPLNSPDQNRQRLNSLIIQERQPTAISLHDKRIQELREKSLMRTEKQLCVCNKLTIVDPFNSEHTDSTLPQLQQSQQQQPSINYIFPPVRPFGYLTKKSTADDSQQLSWSPPPMKKKYGPKKKRHKNSKNSKNSLDSLDKLAVNEANDDDDSSQILNDTIKSMVSLTDIDDELHNVLNLSAPAPMKNTDEQDQS
jgi:hypothetical protein